MLTTSAQRHTLHASSTRDATYLRFFIVEIDFLALQHKQCDKVHARGGEGGGCCRQAQHHTWHASLTSDEPYPLACEIDCLSVAIL